MGYNVLLAETGEKAIEIIETFEGKIDLVLLDIGMPDIQGDKVYSRIIKSRPDLKVLICSGYTLDGPAQKIIDAGSHGFISKPYSFTVLSKKIKDAFSSEQ